MCPALSTESIEKGLCEKLRVSGFHPTVIAFLISWSEDRQCRVVLGGVQSPDETSANSVFQRTVYGPTLRNIFYADARCSIIARGFVETVFADDFNCWRPFRVRSDQVDSAQAAAVVELRNAQHELHRSGEGNRMVFDP